MTSYADEDGERAAVNPLRRRIVIAAVVVVAVAAVLLWVRLGGGDGARDSAGGAATSEPTESTTPGEADPSGSTSETPGVPPPDDPNGIPSLAPVPLDETVDYGNGVTAAIDDVTAFEADGRGVGEISGPALRVTISITNDTAEVLAMDGATVNLAYGQNQSPASPVSDPTALPLSGTVAAGDSAAGSYSFSVPEGQARESVTITVIYTVGSVTAVFTGAVS